MKTKFEHNNIPQILSKNLGLRILGIVLLSLFSFATFASQTPACSIPKPNGSSCYTTTLRSVTQISGGSYTIVMLVSVDGSSGGNGGAGCQALSHYAVSAVAGTFSDVSWSRVTGSVNFTGIDLGPGIGNSQSFNTGFKLTGPSNFGDNNAGSFTLTYTVSALQDQQFAAKAGNYDNIALFTVADFNQVLNCSNLLPVAIDDEKTINYFASGSVVEAIPSVLSNDLYNGVAIIPSQVTLTQVTAPSNSGIVFTPSTGRVTVAPGTPGGTYTFSYKVSMNSAPANADVATVTIKILQADLGITKTVNPTTVVAGQNIRYTLTVTNYGPTEANDVRVSDVLSPDLTGVTTIPSVGSWSAPIWSIGTLASGASANLDINAIVLATASGTIANSATVSSTTPDINMGNNTANANLIVTALPRPNAVDDNVTTDINTPIVINAFSNDSKGTTPNVISFTSAQPGAAIGTFTITNSATGLVTFTPALNYVGTATINYQITDANEFTSVAKITVVISAGTINNFPGTGFSTVAFEDLWPYKGDYDLNDLVMDYKFEITSNSSNYVSKVVGTFVIKAFGASFENGFGFQFPNVQNTSITSVSGYDLKEGFITLNSNGTESGQTKPTIIVYDNAFKEMTSPGGIGVNTDPTQAYVTPKTLTITINFAPNTCLYNTLDIANFNPFIFVNKVRGVEVHLPDFAPTSLANPSLFGTGDDNSIPSQGKYYKTVNNLPWAINTYEQFDYPKEKVDISQAFLHFAAWATSGGISFTDWYKDLSGYRNASLIYPIHH